MIEIAKTMPGGYAAPSRDESTEADLRKVVKGMDGLLDVKWVQQVFYNQRHKQWEGRYALTCDWPSADKRWEMVRSGEVDPKLAHDIIGWLCTDMQDPQSIPLGIAGVEGLVIELLGKMDNTRYPWKQRFLSAIDKNKKRRDGIKNDALDFVHDEAEYNYRKFKNIPQSTGVNLDTKGKII